MTTKLAATICQKCERIEYTNDGLCFDCYTDLQVEIAENKDESTLNPQDAI